MLSVQRLAAACGMAAPLKNVILKTTPVPASLGQCAGLSVESVLNANGETWVFPALSLADSALKGDGLRVRRRTDSGKTPPPGS